MAASNQTRPFQPVTEIAKALGAARGVTVRPNLLMKTGPTPQLKNIDDASERRAMPKATLRLTSTADLPGTRVLLVDDLFRSGDSLRAATELLVEAGVEQVSVLTMTKTRNG